MAERVRSICHELFCKKVFLQILQYLQESICAGVSFSIKLQAGGQHLPQIENLVQVLYCEFCRIVKKTNFIYVYERLLLKSKIFVRVCFRKVSGFYYKWNRQLFHFEGTGRYVFLKIPKQLLNNVIFQNSFERLLFKTPQEKKACTKLTTKSTRTASGNDIRVYLSLTWNITLKSVMEFVLSKASDLYEKQR